MTADRSYALRGQNIFICLPLELSIETGEARELEHWEEWLGVELGTPVPRRGQPTVDATKYTKSEAQGVVRSGALVDERYRNDERAYGVTNTEIRAKSKGPYLSRCSHVPDGDNTKVRHPVASLGYFAPAGIEEVVGAATIESGPEEVKEDVLLQLLKPAVAGVDQILNVVILVVQDDKLLQARHDRPQDTRHLQL